MTEGETSQPRKPLPMWPIVREACLLPWNRRQHFGRLLVIPATLTALISVTGSYLNAGKGPDSFAYQLLVEFLLDFLVLTFFAVSCHRSILIGEHSVSQFGIPTWSMRETRFYLWLVGIYVIGTFFMGLFATFIGMLSTGIVGSLGKIGELQTIILHPAYLYSSMAILLVPFAYIVGRLSPLLPAVAVDCRPNINSIWAQSEGNGWRVAVLVGMIPVLFGVLQGLLGMLLEWVTGITIHAEGVVKWHGIYSIITAGWQAVLRYAFATVEVAILSLTFKELSGWQPGEAQVGKGSA